MLDGLCAMLAPFLLKWCNVAPFFLKFGLIVLIPASKMLESDTTESKATGIRVTFLVLFCSIVSDLAFTWHETNVGRACDECGTAQRGH